MTRSPASRLLVLLGAAALLAAGASGCGVFYRNRVSSPHFTLYSDRSPALLEQVARKLSRIYTAYSELLGVSAQQLGRPAVFLEGEDCVVEDLRGDPDLLGYYLPLLNLIAVSALPASGHDEELLDQVLLHEVAHHFIVTERPQASEECWLNEGLAGALEVCLFDDRRFETPLFNPLLFTAAQNAAYGKTPLPRLAALLEMSWDEFHGEEAKEVNYALAWSIVYFLLERKSDPSRPLGERVRELYTRDRGEIVRLEPEWVSFLRGFNLARHLITLAQSTDPSRTLTSLWAARSAGSMGTTDELSALEGLVELLDSPRRDLRLEARRAFVHKLERASHSHFTGHQAVLRGVTVVARAALDEDSSIDDRALLLETLGDCRRSGAYWLPVLVRCLESPVGDVRAAAAQSLARLGGKPTRVNPAFWRFAPAAERQSEALEWRQWLEAAPTASLTPEAPGATVPAG